MTQVPIDLAPVRKSLKVRRAGNAAAAGDKRPGSRALKDHPRLKIQIDFPGGARLGPGKIALLEAIDSEGSLSRAAEKLTISYRRAWLFMQQINEAFDQPAVATPESGHGGGPARLTAFGKELIRHYRTMEDEAGRAGQQTIAWLERHSGGSGSGQGFGG